MGQHDLTCEHRDGILALGPLQLNPFELPNAGDFLAGHKHTYDHVTIITMGRAHVLASPNVNLLADMERRGPKFSPFGTADSYDPAVLARDPSDAEDWKVGCFGPGEPFLVLADWYHKITALVPGTRGYCLFTNRDHDGNVVPMFVKWEF